MPIKPLKLVLTLLALALPAIAHAQEIPPLIFVLAVSPVLVAGLAIALGFVSRSWRVGVTHLGLIGIWILLFVVASYWVESDIVIWTPLVLYGIHAATLLVMLTRSVLQRIRD